MTPAPQASRGRRGQGGGPSPPSVEMGPAVRWCSSCASGVLKDMPRWSTYHRREPPGIAPAKPPALETASESRTHQTDGSKRRVLGKLGRATSSRLRWDTGGFAGARTAHRQNTDETSRSTEFKPSALRTTVTHHRYGGRRPVTARKTRSRDPPSRRQPTPGYRWRERGRVRLPDERAFRSVGEPFTGPSGVLTPLLGSGHDVQHPAGVRGHHHVPDCGHNVSRGSADGDRSDQRLPGVRVVVADQVAGLVTR